MTQDELIELAKQAGFERLGHTDNDWVCYPEDIEAFAKLVATKERDACAKVAYDYTVKVSLPNFYESAEYVAQAIRARGQA